jgi:hypothetical protein
MESIGGLKMNKERLFYYGTVIPLTVMLLYLYGEYKDQEKTIHDTYRICNRQIEVINMSNQKQISQLIKFNEKK